MLAHLCPSRTTLCRCINTLREAHLEKPDQLYLCRTLDFRLKQGLNGCDFLTNQGTRYKWLAYLDILSDCTKEAVQHMQVVSWKELDVRWVKDGTFDKISGVVL